MKYSAIIAFLTLVSGSVIPYSGLATETVPETQPDTQIHISVSHPPIKSEHVIETVIIDNVPYEVPEPWSGNRLFPTTRNLDELEQIPTEFTHDSSEIYIYKEAYEPFVAMLTKAHEDGIELVAESAYRSINYQNRIFQRRMNQGRTFDEICTSVAPPGYSQHMLGTAIDFIPSDWTFAESEQYQWLQQNAHEFGFEETFSRNNRFLYSWESWHWNYVGRSDPEAEKKDIPSPSNTNETTDLMSSTGESIQD